MSRQDERYRHFDDELSSRIEYGMYDSARKYVLSNRDMLGEPEVQSLLDVIDRHETEARANTLADSS